MTQDKGQVPEALRLAALLDADEWPGSMTLVSYARACAAELCRLHALTAQDPSQPGGFSSGDMASAAAQGYRDGWTAAQADSAEPAVHVQNPAENEHVAGDVSKNGVGSNMGAAYAELPDSLICAVDQWFADNIKDSDGCTTQDVRELAEIFYGVTHEGGRESVDDALAIVKSFGPGIGGINDTYARQVLLAEEVERLRGQATNAKKTGELLMGLAVIRELTGTQQKGLEETIEAVRAAVNAQKHPPAPATLAVNDDLRDRLVAISEAIADQDDRAAQAMLREILKAPQPSPTAQAAESVPAIQGEMNVQLDIDSNHSAPGQQRDVARSVALGQPMGNGQDQAAGRPSAQGDKLLTVAERNIRSFLRSATFKSESDREAALNCVDVLWEAARATAVSVPEDAARESEYRRGYRHGYEQRDAEVRGAMA